MAVIHRLRTLQKSVPSVNWSDYDLLMEAKVIMPSNIRFEHVKGHQGNQCHPDFNLQTNLNILMDMRAKQGQEKRSTPTSKLSFSLQYQGKLVSGPIVQTLRESISQRRLQQFYEMKMGAQFKEVHWEAFKHACSKYKINKSMCKLIHNIAPTLESFYKKKLSQDALCPICFKAEETNQHVLVCPGWSDIYCTMFCDNVINKLKLKQDFDRQWLEDIFISITTKPVGKLSGFMFEQQNLLGWRYCVRGFFTTEWNEVVERLPTKKTGTETLGCIIGEIWNTWNTAWKHRNESFKTEHRYLHQCSIKQRTVDLHIIYKVRDYIPVELQGSMMASVDDHLELDSKVVDDWIKMYLPIFYQVVQEVNKDLWRNTEQEVLDELEM